MCSTGWKECISYSKTTYRSCTSSRVSDNFLTLNIEQSQYEHIYADELSSTLKLSNSLICCISQAPYHMVADYCHILLMYQPQLFLFSWKFSLPAILSYIRTHINLRNQFLSLKHVISYNTIFLFREAYIAMAVLRLVEEEKCVVEGAGAVGLAALIAGMVPELKGKR